MLYSKNIEKLDLTLVIGRLKREEDLSIAEIEKAITEYKAYLELRLTHGIQEEIHPTVAADLVWHYHILDTQKYMQDCDMVFGEYLHHNPNVEVTPGSTRRKQRPIDLAAPSLCV